MLFPKCMVVAATLVLAVADAQIITITNTETLPAIITTPAPDTTTAGTVPSSTPISTVFSTTAKDSSAQPRDTLLPVPSIVTETITKNAPTISSAITTQIPLPPSLSTGWATYTATVPVTVTVCNAPTSTAQKGGSNAITHNVSPFALMVFGLLGLAPMI